MAKEPKKDEQKKDEPKKDEKKDKEGYSTHKGNAPWN